MVVVVVAAVRSLVRALNADIDWQLMMMILTVLSVLLKSSFKDNDAIVEGKVAYGL